MKTTALTVALVGVLLMTGLLSGMASGPNGRRVRIEKKSEDVCPTLLSSQFQWETETKYVMQWDDGSKKLLFDGRAISHAKKPCFTFNGVHITNPDDILAPLPARADSYSFDVESISKLGVAHESNKYDGRLRSSLQWNEEEMRFVSFEPEPVQQELFEYYVPFRR